MGKGYARHTSSSSLRRLTHPPEAGDQPPQLYQLIQFLTAKKKKKEKKKTFLTGVNQLAGFSELPVRLYTPKHALSKA